MQCRVLYLMDLDYRKGEINLEDLNSDKEYDPDKAFTQSQLANMLAVTNLAEQWRDHNVTVNAVSTVTDCFVMMTTICLPRCTPECALQTSRDTWGWIEASPATSSPTRCCGC